MLGVHLLLQVTRGLALLIEPLLFLLDLGSLVADLDVFFASFLLELLDLLLFLSAISVQGLPALLELIPLLYIL